MSELTDVLYGKPVDGSPTVTDYLFTYDAETNQLKKALIPDIVAVVGLLKTLADAKGDLLIASANDVFGRLPAGGDGQMLYVDGAQPLGIKWGAPPSGTGISPGIVDAKGDLLSASAADTPARFPVGSNGQILYADDTQAVGLRWDAAPTLAPGISPTIVDAKGDLIGASGPDTPARVPVGTDGQMFYADSTQPLGVRWGSPPSGSGITAGIMDAKGDLLAASGDDTPVRFAVGANGQILVADSSQAAGLLWQNRQGKVTSVTSLAAPAPDVSDAQYNITAAAVNMVVAAVTGSPSDGQKLMFRFKDNGTGRSIGWNAIYRGIGITLPLATTANKTTYVGFIYNSAEVKWDGVATVTQA